MQGIYSLFSAKNHQTLCVTPKGEAFLCTLSEGEHGLEASSAYVIPRYRSQSAIDILIIDKNFKYLASEPSGRLIFNRDIPQGWEQFKLVQVNSDANQYSQDLADSTYLLEDFHKRTLFDATPFKLSISSWISRMTKIAFPDSFLHYGYREKKKSIEEKYAKTRSLKVEIGAGFKKRSDDWIEIDQNSSCDISWDLRHGIPLPDSSVSLLYSSHTLEHIPFQEQGALLAECLRVLEPGGRFSVCVPDAQKYIDSYINNLDMIPHVSESNPLSSYTGSAIDQLNFLAYMAGHHKYMFDKQNIINVLARAGFVNCITRRFDPELDLKDRDWESLYAEATKPYPT